MKTTHLHLLCETELKTYGKSRYYVDSKRIPQSTFRSIKSSADLDTFQTVKRQGCRRLFCCARISSSVLTAILAE